MYPYLMDMILSGLAYLILVYFMVRMMRINKKRPRKDDEDDGGINITTLPEIDLPPGISLPDNSPSLKKEEAEPETVCT